MSNIHKLQYLAAALRDVANRYLSTGGDTNTYWHQRASLIEDVVSALEREPGGLADHGDSFDQIAELCDVLSESTILAPDVRDFWCGQARFLRDLASQAHYERRARDAKELSKISTVSRFRLMFGQTFAPNQN